MRTEKGLSIAFLVGLLIKYLHWPGGGLIVVLSLSSLALLYCPGAFYFFRDKNSKSNLPLSIISGFFLSIAPIGILFKIQYWPGADINLLVGMVFSIVFLVISILLSKNASEELHDFYKNMKLRTAVLVILTTGLYFISTETLVRIQYWNNPEMARIKSLHYAHPENEEYRKEHNEYMMSLDSNYQAEKPLEKK